MGTFEATRQEQQADPAPSESAPPRWSGSTRAAVGIPTLRDTVDRARAQALRPVATLPGFLPRVLLRAHHCHGCEVTRLQGLAWADALLGQDNLLAARDGQAAADVFGGLTEWPPRVLYHLPAGRGRVHRAYLTEQLRTLGDILTEISDHRATDLDWHEAFTAEGLADAAIAEIYRTRHRIGASDRDVLAVVRSRWTLLPDDVLTTISRLPEEPRSVLPGVPVVLSGTLTRLDVVDNLNNAGVRVCADDLSTGSRRLLPSPDASIADPYERIADQIIRAPADPLRADAVTDRVARLVELLGTYRADALVIVHPPGYQLEERYAHAVARGVGRHGWPVIRLVLDGEGGLGTRALAPLREYLEGRS